MHRAMRVVRYPWRWATKKAPKTTALTTALVAWAMIPLPGVFEGVIYALWPKKKKITSPSDDQASSSESSPGHTGQSFGAPSPGALRSPVQSHADLDP